MSNEHDDPLVRHSQSRIGQQLGGKWRLDALIGVGGMAAVYASSHRNGARAAIKILHPEMAGHHEVRTRFLREAYIANKVDHPGTVKVLDDDVSEGGEPYLVMELLTGESVEGRAARNGGWLRYPEVLSIVEQTLAVLEKAHAAGVVHRDLKPDNLFITSRGEVKVLDFGIARLHEAGTPAAKRTQTGLMMGTPSFMAPEQALGKWAQVDGRTDLWSVGAILFTLLSGRHVHEAQTDNEMMIRAATRPAPSFARVVSNAPVDLVRVVDKVLQFDQANRFEDATAMRAAIRALMGSANVAPWGGGARSAALAMPPVVPTTVQTAPVAPARAEPAPQPPAGSEPAPIAKASVPPPAGTSVGSGPDPAVPLAPAPRPSSPPGGGAPTAFQGGFFAPDGAAPSPAASPRRQPREANSAEGYDATFASPEDVEALRGMFTDVEKAIIARTQYGPTHPETRRRADAAFKACASALMRSEYGLSWNITPYAFVAGEESVWEPDAPLDRIPYQLFADGVRVLGLTQGLDEVEFRGFIRLLMLDRTSEVAPEDDFATLLWDAAFEHVVYQVADTFADGDQEQRLRFQQNCDRIVQLAHFDTRDFLEEAWQERQGMARNESVGVRQSRIVTRLSAGSNDTGAIARAAELRVAESGAAPIDPGVLRVDDAVRTMLGARLTLQSSGLSERFAAAAARAYEDGFRRDGGGSVTTPLRAAVDGLAKQNPGLAIDMVGVLCGEVGAGFPAAEAERLRATFAAAIVSPKMVDSVLDGVCAEGADRAMFARGLRTILGYCDETYFSVVLRRLGAMPDLELRDVLVQYLVRTGAGHEAELGALFEGADVELGLALVRILAGMSSPAAREAIALAVHSRHPVVRIEALGHVEGVSSERLRLELRTLLEDREPGVRLAALRAMEQYGIRVAGPFLVLRVRSPEFDGLPTDERRQALVTLAALAPARAESVALELVNERRLVASGEHEASRELGVELLGRIGTGEETRAVLADLATARFRNSDRVRAAAARALEVLAARAKEPKPRGAERQRT